jgi:hypothetical protein
MSGCLSVLGSLYLYRHDQAHATEAGMSFLLLYKYSLRIAVDFLLPFSWGMPMQYEERIVIKAPVERIWQLYADVNHWSKWDPEAGISRRRGRGRRYGLSRWCRMCRSRWRVDRRCQSSSLTISSSRRAIASKSFIAWSLPGCWLPCGAG